MTELLLGCGHSRQKLLSLPGEPLVWKDLVTLDFNKKCKPDILCNIDPACVGAIYGAEFDWEIEECWHGSMKFCEREEEQIFFAENQFDEVHAYEVLEHLGHLGEIASFFCTFYNIHRILKSGGHLFATVPSRYSGWLWGDPSHRRVICAESLAFLSQEVIARNRAAGTAMSDFSDLWTRDFKIVSAQDNRERFMFCLQAIK